MATDNVRLERMEIGMQLLLLRMAEKDGEAEKLARAELITEANLGGQGETTQLNPLVPVSKATAEKLSNELDEVGRNRTARWSKSGRTCVVS
ncbi:Resolvase/invertase-type recombinase catalytic domain-containing protein [Caenorhabditis elegans]|uniref:Resolvase/invertase-type recombinase catalytic domain-containing protein n=1 Tax=Caenorhabditis elegans TaxID=6239 RepID=Q20104_CAEEL|nr:Resolvase/invertase-type recombinase catalytic domain-containing protein [Caenorhabditis elegans]CCD68609.2 Resolvase/invertase-type recombinase catalytic domain-containing protein [Caenorhabditis elegans]|eukprot:NP_001294716.2 Uncharacterized protein CELE_F36D4.6 [Caenorhabditis elegans]